MEPIDRRRRRSRIILAIVAVLVIIAAAVAIFGGAAHSSPKPQSTALAAQKPGGECTKAGATFKRHGEVYECVQKPWDDCLRWHHRKPADYQPPASWTRPAQRPCTTCTPSPSASTPPSSPPVSTPPATTPPATTPPVASPTPPATTTPALPHPSDSTTPAPPITSLPVTGSPVPLLIGLALLCIVVGALLRFYRRSVREADADELSVR